MSSIFDRIFGWFGGSKREEEPAAEEDQVLAVEEEHASEFRGDGYEHGSPEEPVEEEWASDLDDDDDSWRPEDFVDDMERAHAFRHEDSFPPLHEQDASESVQSLKPWWLREKKEEES